MKEKLLDILIMKSKIGVEHWILAFAIYTFGGHSAFGTELTFTGSEDFRPFYFQTENSVEGPMPEIIRLICLEAQLTCHFDLFPWRRAMMFVENGEVNGIIMVGKNEDRMKWLVYTPPILQTEYGFFVREDNPLKYQTPSDIAGYHISAIGPSNMSESLMLLKSEMKQQGLKEITIEIEMTMERTLKRLLRDWTDAFYSNREVGMMSIKDLRLTNIRYAGPHKKLKYHIALAKQFNDDMVIKQFMQAFHKLQNRNSIRSILKQHHLDSATSD